MASITPVFDIDGFNDPYFLDWTAHPQRGAWRRPRDVDRATARYLFDVATVEVDIAGPKNVVSRCSSQFFGTGFLIGEGVLLGDNLAGRMPVHLFFPTPMRSIGARVSANGAAGQSYLAQCSVRLDDGQWHAVQPQLATLTPSARDLAATAPMLGAIASPDSGIVEAWFDVIDPGNVVDFRQVAIGDLLFLPV